MKTIISKAASLAFGAFAMAVAAGTAHAGVVTVMIGDDDGFGGTQGAMSTPGDSYSNAAAAPLGAIAPGSYSNAAATDINTEAPWEVYIFTFEFAYDASSLSTIGGATVEVQHGSLSRRSAGSSPGFGFAAVSATTGGPATGLGDFFTTVTGVAGTAHEESVKRSSFDVTSLIAAGSMGVLTVTIDGTGISPNPVDLFAIDFARLTLRGDMVQVPEPTPLALFGLGLAGIGFAARRKRKAG